MKFYSNGKLLISGEYLVLKGALALAAPVRFGQYLEFKEISDERKVIWKSFNREQLWFSAVLSAVDFSIISTDDQTIAEKLSLILTKTRMLNKDFINPDYSISVETNTNFDINWGLGSSSSLLSNIAHWADIDPFELHFSLNSGSGFDIACARSENPLFYKMDRFTPRIEPVFFNPDFRDQIYFIYTGKKQNSEKSVISFNQKKRSFRSETKQISELSKHIACAAYLSDFEYYIHEHEIIISSILKEDRIKNKYFSHFDGEIKSLGAWGGDFMMVTWEGTVDSLRNYFGKYNLQTLFSFDEMIRTE